LWPDGLVAKPVCSWLTFLSFWAEHYPNIKVCRKGADTCGDCLKILLNIKANSLSSAVLEDNNNDLEEEVEDALATTLSGLETHRNEGLAHVKKYTIQREVTNSAINKAREDVAENVNFDCQNHCLKFDMGQNVALPNPGADQVRDVYYFSPVNIYVFGVVDNSRPTGKGIMNAYIWHEKDGN